MVEIVQVSFSFGQNEYEASIPTYNDERKQLIRLTDLGTLLHIVLDEKTHAISTMKTVESSAAVPTDYQSEIWNVDPVPENRKFRSSKPQLVKYQVKLKDGRIVRAELRLDTFGSTPCWHRAPYGKCELIPDSEVAGWRVDG